MSARKTAFTALLSTAALSACTTSQSGPLHDSTLAAAPAKSDASRLEAGFTNPPTEARPWVWWHWMNGNVDAAEAEKDLDWMAANGVGGVFQFEGGLGAPQQIPTLQPYLSPGWNAALRRSLARAHALGMQFGIATSPGWSATGGPWVKPADAMKKLVWSETTLPAAPTAGRQDGVTLPLPPQVPGPYQDIASPEARPDEHFYADVAVIAFPATTRRIEPVRIEGARDVNATLRDGRYGPALTVQGDADGLARITYDLGAKREVRSARIGLPGPRGFGTPQPPVATLEASTNRKDWRAIARLEATASSVRTASFAPVSARYFRLSITPDPRPSFTDQLSYAPGAIPIPFPHSDGVYQLSELTLWGNALVNSAEEKAGFAAASDYANLATPPHAPGIDPAQILDLTQALRSDGTLDWSPPDRRSWTILRFGTSLTGHHNGPAPEEATGLEVDKLSAGKVEAYLRHYLDLYDTALGEGETLDALLSDSIEAGAQNWTDAMPEQFARAQGYPLTPWLPALAGFVVGDGARSDAFLHDYRDTIARLVASAHYGTIARVAKERGLTYTAEALEDHRPQLGNDLAMRAPADVPAGAMWWFGKEGRSKATYEADVKGAASVAHVLGKPVTAVEALTAFGQPWALTPADMRPAADLALVLGGNRLMLHSSVHQAAGDKVFPGMTMLPMLGHYFNRNEAWAGMARAWTDYLARAQFLLRQGHAVNEIAWFTGEDDPVTGLYGDVMPKVPHGFDYDFLDTTLLSALDVREGQLHNRSGNSYQLLWLGRNSRHASLALLERLGQLAAQGVRIAGARPVGSPKLTDDAQEYERVASAVWSRPNVEEAEDIGTALHAFAIKPAWALDGTDATSVAVQHRKLAEGDLYFLVNRADAPFSGWLTSVPDAKAQWWDAASGSREKASADAKDIVVQLEPLESRFLVIAPTLSPLPGYTAPAPLAEADSPWTVELQSRGLAPRSLELSGLARLDFADHPLLRDFSGTAYYKGSIALPRGTRTCSAGRIVLDLGDMADMAKVVIDGHEVGTVWNRNQTLDVTKAVHAGRMELEIEVATTWVNRLIKEAREHPEGDAARLYRPDAPRRPSGLGGPVRLLQSCPRQDLRPS